VKRARDQVTGKASKRTSSKTEGPRSFVQNGQNGNGRAKSGRSGRNGGFTLAEALASLSRSDLEDIYQFWEGSKEPETPAADDELRDVLSAWMKDPAVVEERVSELGRRLGSVVEDLLSAPRYQKSWTELANARALAYMTAYDLEACLAALVAVSWSRATTGASRTTGSASWASRWRWATAWRTAGARRCAASSAR
jgi:hypothetical protein